MSKDLLIAAYENKRLLILSTFLNHPGKVPPALAYAHDKRIAPIFHENIARECYGMDPYAEIYAVKARFVEEVSKHIDKLWLAKNLKNVGFQDLETSFGGYKANRMELVHAIRYMYLDDRFDDELYSAIKVGAPLEAHGIMDGYTPDDVEFK